MLTRLLLTRLLLTSLSQARLAQRGVEGRRCHRCRRCRRFRRFRRCGLGRFSAFRRGCGGRIFTADVLSCLSTGRRADPRGGTMDAVPGLRLTAAGRRACAAGAEARASAPGAADCAVRQEHCRGSREKKR